jgi:hypothetical protein
MVPDTHTTLRNELMRRRLLDPLNACQSKDRRHVKYVGDVQP